MGCDLDRETLHLLRVSFQSTHPRGVRRVFPVCGRAARWFQSTHPRGVRPARHAYITDGSQVSIHAPAWGATPAIPPTAAPTPVSIHAPAWGATATVLLTLAAGPKVSIHAPAWGATSHPNAATTAEDGFNPRTRVGCDASATRHRMPFCAFQSTHPRGVRPRRYGCTAARTPFQSTHPRGVRLSRKSRLPSWDDLFQSTHPRGVRRNAEIISKTADLVSIHAPAWGATRPAKDWPRKRRVSIPAPAWGATFGVGGLSRAGIVSIHAPAWGATGHMAGGVQQQAVSIHAPAWGATIKPTIKTPNKISFNPRTRVGCDKTQMYRLRPGEGFQSTHPRGVRHLSCRLMSGLSASFNPRTRVGCDAGDGIDITHLSRFNPRTRVGCDSLTILGCLLKLTVSIHAPAWGATSPFRAS